MACDTGYGKTYATIVMVAAVLQTMFGIGDVIGSAMIIDECSYSAGLIPLLLNALGVVTILSGVLIFYVLGREMELSILYTNVYWTSYKVTIWIFTCLTYLTGLTLVAILETVTKGVQDSGCTEVRKYVQFHVFATVAVPFAPIVLIGILIAIALTVLALYIACVCLELLGSNTESND